LSLIALLAALLVDRLLSPGHAFRRTDWFERYVRALVERLNPGGLLDGGLGVAVALLPPVAAVYLISAILDGALFGVLSLAFSILVLSYGMDLRSLEEDIDGYVEATEATAERHAAARLLGLPVPSDSLTRLRAAARAALSEANGRVFAVVFWFLVLGPVGAALYRLSRILEHRGGDWSLALGARAAQWLALLDWIPARLLAVSYALAGSLDDAMPALRDNVWLPDEPVAVQNDELLSGAGAGAMRMDEMTERGWEPAMVSSVMGAARDLIVRALVVWVTLLALLTLVHLFS